ncbi:uncharacterized protein FFB20_00376 [Fusarium fujikuroi]|uniref:Uncharacterized protein n=1 Tax=Gibberella fujikuroi (strain CBS 195.34 / IMI 58289 / NRRL A-6831) TaxID=1279085 RepID=S0DPI9_GIBF5|nr:uncharacterized protein FFUJ_04301 [Fusarium fujikuroi IMI 58289]SCN64159.1 uncharacterized protein FFB20_00376 [Fusarium fujikuroi]CCT64474.1 uncharacterized protein FFUJ_04301 [Fusarium fujikuroi IMI 58289]SCN73673.1 uncharacterized protein FFE2_02908 [Fusarium fujikuroi]SCN88335.1 uncharacterized protein FFM5_04360 [Fusarium fujikuroi]SCO04859.1 uncharacterized protein FFC1_09787 [Fusarium fujikuroi]
MATYKSYTYTSDREGDFYTIDKALAEDKDKEPETFVDYERKTNKIRGSVPDVHTGKAKCKNKAKKSTEDDGGLESAINKSLRRSLRPKMGHSGSQSFPIPPDD